MFSEAGQGFLSGVFSILHPNIMPRKIQENLMSGNISFHTICIYPDRGYATFVAESSSFWRTYALALNADGEETLLLEEPQLSVEVGATDCTGSRFLYTDDAWVAEHTKAYIMSYEQLSLVENGLYLVHVRSGELVAMSSIEQSSMADRIGYDWDGMGVEYVGIDFLSQCLSRIDFDDDQVSLFVGIGD